uniref:Putative secreted protein n=1 Tax=Amblyomma americanum TaxID=6943 RepID=A0A0C9S3J3_AMBAM
MRFPICAALLLAASLLRCCVQACSSGKQWSFCPREGNPNGKLCPGLWPRTCAWLSIQCGCPHGQFEHENGSCVALRHCPTADSIKKPYRVYSSTRKASLRRKRHG